MLYLKDGWFLTGITFHYRSFNHGLEPQPVPLNIAGVAVNTLRILAPHKVQAGGSWFIAKSNSTITSSPGHS